MPHPSVIFLNRFRRDQSGAVAVEFVLIGPMLFALLFGIVSLGYYIGVSHSVSQLASGAVRASVAGIDTQERTELAQAYLARASVNYPLLTQDAITPSVQPQSDNVPGMTVNVRYAVDGSVLDIANSLLGLNISDIEGSAYLAY